MAKVLVVDDDPEIRATIQTYLGADYHVLTAKDGQEGLEVFLRESPQVVIADIKMPRMNGIELAKKIRATSGDVAIVILTGYVETDYVIEAIRFEASDFLSKPLDIERLRQAIEHGLKKT